MNSNSSISSTVTYLLETYWLDNGDPRVQSLPFSYSIRPVIIVLTLYLTFVLWLGPRFMQNRKPFVLHKTLLYYNIFMTLSNGFFFFKLMQHYDVTFPRMFAMSYPDVRDTSDTVVMANLPYFHLYMFTKFVDLLDTVFFILRKKKNQITALHVYHHFSVAFFGWIYFRLNFQCNLLFPFGVLNTFIHTLMYAYYGLSTLGDAVRRYLWWKRYLTQLQLAQFVIIIAYGVYFFFFQQNYPTFLVSNMIVQAAIYLVLFLRFYFKTYQKSPTSNSLKENLYSEGKIKDL